MLILILLNLFLFILFKLCILHVLFIGLGGQVVINLALRFLLAWRMFFILRDFGSRVFYHGFHVFVSCFLGCLFNDNFFSLRYGSLFLFILGIRISFVFGVFFKLFLVIFFYFVFGDHFRRSINRGINL